MIGVALAEAEPMIAPLAKSPPERRPIIAASWTQPMYARPSHFLEARLKCLSRAITMTFGRWCFGERFVSFADEGT